MEGKGTSANWGRFVKIIFHDVAEVFRIEVTRQQAQAQIAQRITLNFIESDNDRQGIGRLDAGDLLNNALAWGLDCIVGNRIIGEFEIGRIHRIAITPDNIVTQAEGPGQAICRGFPTFGERTIRHQGTSDGILTNQPRKYHAIDRATCGFAAQNWIKNRGIAGRGARPNATGLAGNSRCGTVIAGRGCTTFGGRCSAGHNRHRLGTARQ